MLTQDAIILWETRLTDSIRIQFCCHINQETLNVAASFQDFALSFHGAICFAVLYHFKPLDVAVTRAFVWQKPGAGGKNLRMGG